MLPAKRCSEIGKTCALTGNQAGDEKDCYKCGFHMHIDLQYVYVSASLYVLPAWLSLPVCVQYCLCGAFSRAFESVRLMSSV